MSRPDLRLRALVLSAGFGTRLRPLTHTLAKPLLPIGPEPVAGHTLQRLAGAGCESAVLNLHYRAETIPAHFGRSYFGLPLEYTHEKEIQGTLGALVPARRHLRAADAVVLVNGDSFCRWPIEAMVRRHHETKADATLLLLRRRPEEALGGGIAIDGRGKVVGLRDYDTRGEVASRHVFAGCHLLSTRLLDRVPAGFGDIIEGLYQPLLEEGGRIESVVGTRPWHDLGTPGRYLEACLDWAEGSPWNRLHPRLERKRVSTLAELHPRTRLRRSLVGRGARIGEGAQLVDTVVLEGARVGEGCQLERCILGPGVEIGAGSGLENRMICRLDPRHELGADESVMGDLVYTPI